MRQARAPTMAVSGLNSYCLTLFKVFCFQN